MSDKTEYAGYRQAKAIARLVARTTGTKERKINFDTWRKDAKSVVTGRRGPMSGKSRTLVKKAAKQYTTSGTSRLSMKGRKTTVAKRSANWPAANKRRVNRI